MSCKCKEQLCRGWPQEANHKLHDLHRWIQKLGQPHKNVAPEYIHIAHESCLPWNSQQISSKEEEKKILKELLLSTIFGYFGLYPCDSLSYLPLCFVRATSTGSARKIPCNLRSVALRSPKNQSQLQPSFCHTQGLQDCLQVAFKHGSVFFVIPEELGHFR